MDRHHRRRALIETFEQRILYSADPLPSGELVSALVGLEHTDGATADGGGVELVFVDTRSPDLQLLLDDLEAVGMAVGVGLPFSREGFSLPGWVVGWVLFFRKSEYKCGGLE